MGTARERVPLRLPRPAKRGEGWGEGVRRDAAGPPSCSSPPRWRARTSPRRRPRRCRISGPRSPAATCAAAYALTSADFQKRTPYEAFAAGLGSNAADTAALGKRVGEQAARVAPRVDVQLGQGEALSLVLEAGRWRIDGPVPEPWGQRTPRAALRTFVRALGERRYDVVLRLVPRRHRVDLTADKLRQYWEAHQEETRALLARLQAALAAPIVESGDEAHMPYGPEHEVVFVREDGVWRIEDPD